MHTVTVNGERSFKTRAEISDGRFSGSLDGNKVEGEATMVSDRELFLLYNNRSYNIEILRHSPEEKTVQLKVNGEKFSVQLRDQYDDLLHALGMDKALTRKTSEIKAPMPGMVLNILVNEGDEVKKGDPLLVLEAMKMENILKSPADGVVRKVTARKGTAVEKNELLIQF